MTKNDVGIAVKAEFVEDLVKKFPWLEEHPKHVVAQDGKEVGTLFIVEDINWNTVVPGELGHTVTAALNAIGEDNYLLVDACHDYPTSDEGDKGEWHDNPWWLSKCVSVELTYEVG